MAQSAMHGRMGTSQDRITGGGRAALALLRDLVAYAGRGGGVTAAFVAGSAVLEGVGLALIVPLLGIVISPAAPAAPSGRLERAADHAFALLGVQSQMSRLALLMLALGVVVATRAAVFAIRDLRVARLQIGFAETLRLRIAHRLASASWPQLMHLRHARITQLMSEIQGVGAAASMLLRIAVGATMLVALSILVAALAPFVMVAVLAMLGALAVMLLPLVRRAYGLGTDMTRGNVSLMETTSQFLGGLKLAIGQNLQPAFLSEFRRTIDQVSARQIDYAKRQALMRAATTILTMVAAGLLVLAGLGLFHATSATLIALVLVVMRMTGPAMNVHQDVQALARLLPSYASMRALEAELAALPRAHAADTQAPPLPDGPVEFRAVTYRHGDGDAGERGVVALDLIIPPGAGIGVTGASGAGKTTFADLLAGLLAPQEGSIIAGGAPLTATALDQWRARIAYVAQDAFLFHESVRRNLAWMAPQASEDNMWQALEIAGAADLVRRMDAGLETVVGERGTLVSGGERQRLALARAVLRQPRILILDEATSAIDAAGERAILERLRALAARPAIVLIAHRAESLALCDRVLTFADGRVVSESRAMPG
ncbi:MAG: ABC transporter ATP-binding protein [Pseudolabrys sp.]